MVASKALIGRVKNDAEETDFWYVPKGKSVDSKNWPLIAEQLKLLNKYRTMDWHDAQPKYVEDLLKNKLIEPYKDQKEGFSAVARMQLPVWRLLGLAWVNEKNVPEVTDVGRAFIDAKSDKIRQELLAIQLHRYQFWNPSNHPHFSAFRIFPIIGLYRMLTECNYHLTWEEFSLFGTRTRSFEDADDLVDLIDEWRGTPSKERRQIIGLAETIQADGHVKSDEATTIGKVLRSMNYLKAFLSISPNLTVSKDGLSVDKAQRKAVRRIAREGTATSEFVEYQSEQDWLAQYGQIVESNRVDTPWSTSVEARAYYERIGRIDAATAAFAKEEGGKSRKAIENYRSVQIKERVLEDLLEADLEALEKGLRLIGRQYATASGPIDLLAKDGNDFFVVIELKRGRTSDRVVGQIARYLTWVADRLSNGKNDRVRGIVVGTDYDHKFANAIEQLKQVTPYTFDLLVSYDKWKPDGAKARKKTLSAASN
jgi:Endonuclease NucS